MEILITVGLLVISGVGTFFYLQNQENADIISDYKEIKQAYKKFRNENAGLTKGIANVKKYLSSESKVHLDNYEISMDDKFLIVKKVPKKVDPHEVVKQIGGNSVYKNHQIKLSFFSKPSGVEPVAKIKVQPMNNVTTTTLLEYSFEDSIVEEDRVVNVEWHNNEEYFTTEGTHTVKLRVMDKNFKWSEWTSVDIDVKEVKGVKGIYSGGSHLMMLKSNGDVFAFGENGFGQHGDGTSDSSFKLKTVSDINKVTSMAVGDSHTSFLKSDKTVFASGKNDRGQLGIGSKVHSKTPKLTWGLENVVQIASGHGFSAAVCVDGHVYSYGGNENMCLGFNHVDFVDRPTKIDGLENVKSVALGYDHALALCMDGTVTAWGSNKHGQLGTGYKSKSSEPAITQLKEIKMLAAGRGFSLALTKEGRVLGCGLNRMHQLGFEGEREVLFPMELTGLKDIEKIVCSQDFSIALDQMGNIYTWGQYTTIDTDYAVVPMKCEELKYVKDIAASTNYGYALMGNGEVFEFSSKFTNMHQLEVK